MDLIVIDVNFEQQDGDNRKIILNINGGLYGTISADNIHDVCMKLMQSNIVSAFSGKIYINSLGCGIAVIEELKYSFGLTVNSFIPRAVRMWK